MYQTTLFFGWLAVVALVATSWRAVSTRERSWQRLADSAESERQSTTGPRRFAKRLSRRWIWLPWLIGCLVAAGVWWLVGLSFVYTVAIGLVLSLLGSQLESHLAATAATRLETQLADAIDIMIGAVGAGASVGNAIDSAITESRRPLRSHLEEVSGRIRLGDDPAQVFHSLVASVPLEGFLLFASALSVHWEVGGRLAPTLTTVGRTIRDRIDISRRIRTNIAQSQLSTAAIIGLTYFVAAVIWRNGPDQMREFVTSSVGQWFVAASMVLQAAGIVWMNVISKPRM